MICNDKEPVVKKIDQVMALHREDDMVVKESSPSTGCNEHNHFLVGGMTLVLRIDMDNPFDNNFLVLHVMYTQILRHSGWLLNRFCVGRNGDTTFQRYKGRIYSVSCSRYCLPMGSSWIINSVLMSGLARLRRVRVI